jgi:hypothetical protein
MQAMVYTLLGGSILFVLLGAVLAISMRSVDLYILDRYCLISPSRLLFISALSALCALAMWGRQHLA